MNAKTLTALASGFGLLPVSRALAARGDALPFAEAGVSSGRLTWHLLALLVLLAALAAFIYAGLSAFRRSR
jgi:hypothetical protein